MKLYKRKMEQKVDAISTHSYITGNILAHLAYSHLHHARRGSSLVRLLALWLVVWYAVINPEPHALDLNLVCQPA